LVVIGGVWHARKRKRKKTVHGKEALDKFQPGRSLRTKVGLGAFDSEDLNDKLKGAGREMMMCNSSDAHSRVAQIERRGLQ
jgi:hypothetical protein